MGAQHSRSMTMSVLRHGDTGRERTEDERTEREPAPPFDPTSALFASHYESCRARLMRVRLAQDADIVLSSDPVELEEHRAVQPGYWSSPTVTEAMDRVQAIYSSQVNGSCFLGRSSCS
jgi:hypothetical protein